jgi:hypothetical protein
MSDGIYLMNCRRGGAIKNTLAFYKNLIPFGNNGKFPDVIEDINDGQRLWENSNTEGRPPHRATNVVP